MSLITALVGGALPVLRTGLDLVRERKKERAVQQVSFEKALYSIDLKTLGQYLDEQLGAIDVSRYATKNDARQRVDRALSRLETFLGREDTQEQDRPVQVPTTGAYATAIEGLPADVTERLNAGDDWGALIRLRIALERETDAAVKHLKVTLSPRASFRQRLDLLVRREVIDSDVAGSAAASRAIANRAAHGINVDPEDFASALRAGGYALTQLEKVTRTRTTQ